MSWKSITVCLGWLGWLLQQFEVGENPYIYTNLFQHAACTPHPKQGIAVRSKESKGWEIQPEVGICGLSSGWVDLVPCIQKEVNSLFPPSYTALIPIRGFWKLCSTFHFLVEEDFQSRSPNVLCSSALGSTVYKQQAKMSFLNGCPH